jgi:hypothetical protein
LFKDAVAQLGLEREALNDAVLMTSELAANTLHANAAVRTGTGHLDDGDDNAVRRPVRAELWLYLRGLGLQRELVCKVFDCYRGWLDGPPPQPHTAWRRSQPEAAWTRSQPGTPWPQHHPDAAWAPPQRRPEATWPQPEAAWPQSETAWPQPDAAWSLSDPEGGVPGGLENGIPAGLGGGGPAGLEGTMPTEASSGRGLQIVHKLSGGRWGCHPTRARLGGAGARGKAVWFAMPAPFAHARLADVTGLRAYTLSADVSAARRQERISARQAARQLKAMLDERGLGRSATELRRSAEFTGESRAELSVLSVRPSMTLWFRSGAVTLTGPGGYEERWSYADLVEASEQIIRRYEELSEDLFPNRPAALARV